MVDKEPNSYNMVVEFLGKRECLTDESAYPLTERAIEAFDMLSRFAMTVMPISKNNRLIGPEQVGIALSVYVAGRQAIPEALSS